MFKPGIILALFICVLLSSCLMYPGFRKSGKRNQSDQIQTIQLDELKITPKRSDDFRSAPQKLIDIIHTDLEVSFNWGKHECIGKETILLRPYFYETDSIILDAKNMTFNEIAITDMNHEPLQYLTTYDKKSLRLKLERKISTQDSVLLIMRYVAHPDEIDGTGGSAIRDDKGLYFINTDNGEPSKPVQLWTQGEVEANSCWFPTVDKPNEKFTMKLSITVNKDMTTLSNGKLIASTLNGIQKTDVWESKKPLPAYLVMMAVGNFKVTKDFLNSSSTENYQIVTYDTIKIPLNDTTNATRDSVVMKTKTGTRTVTKDLLDGVEVSYYLEPDYAPYALNIFKNTPEMIDFFGAKLGVNYPWEKYAQVVVHDYVSGAMENTSATLHNEFVQKNNRELLDGDNDDIITHELFHQWFGDLVTCKTWSHLVLNEGFATYGEQLWIEYKHGRDAAQAKANSSLARYLNQAKENNDDPIIQFNYKTPDDMFNTITYQKGSLVFNLLRTELGDEAFFLALKNYLNRYAYQNAEIDDLRRECELVSGKDLRFFFNQWFFKGGHPFIELRYDYNDSTKLMAVTVEQKQSRETGLFKFPLKFKVSQGGITKYFNFNIEKRIETFFVQKFDPENAEYPNVFVDPDITFPGEIKDNKPFLNHIKSYLNATSFIEKYRSLKELSNVQATIDTARSVVLSAITDPDAEIRAKAIGWVNWSDPKNEIAKEWLVNLARTDPSTRVRIVATKTLAGLKNALLFNTLVELSNDSSYSIAAAALDGIYKIMPDEALRLCPQLARDARRDLFTRISIIYANKGVLSDSTFFEKNMMKVLGRSRQGLIEDYADFCIRLNDDALYEKAIATLTNRAYNDKNGYVRVTSINALQSIVQKQQGENANEKDAVKRNAKLQTIHALQDSFQRIVDQENDPEMISLLKIKGFSQTSEIKEDR